ncbi:MAG: hypothetical protein EYC69_12795 [Bacteroidetes bacterium]|nr:MAG: hypothetical protein EYC69_12795 [Bacteroidota bacterium]
MAFTGNENHDISFDDAAKLTLRYREKAGSEARKGGFFGRKAIQDLLEQDDCVGIRYYYGLDDNDEQVLVLVGTNADENDLVGSTFLAFENAVFCPPTCGEDNVLNS